MTTRVVVDSSVALKWFLHEPDSDKAVLVLKPGAVLLAPDLLLAEVANGLRRQQRNNVISRDAVQKAIAGLASVFAELVPAEKLIVRALQNSQSLDHSIYDCLFLTVSQMHNVPLVTADAAFAAKLAKTPDARNVILLSDWN